jgi:protein TonB
MTGPQQYGDLVASRSQESGTAAGLHEVVVRADPPSSPSPAADLSNVIPFKRGRRAGAEPATPPVTISPEDRPAPPPPGTSVAKQIALVVCSVAAHGLLLFAFWEEPRPLASIGIEAITVEIMVGDNLPPAPKSGEPAEEVRAEEVKADDKPLEEKQERVAEARETETAKEEQADQPKEQPPDKRDELAMVESPQAETPTAPPRETPPDVNAVITPPREQPKEARPVEPKAKQPVQKKSDEKKTEQKKVTRQTPSEAAGGVGRQSVASDANYNGMVSAHLRRHQRTNTTGVMGKGRVTFSINGSGSVTSVSVAQSTGAAVLDQEMVASVRRASPFPAPPDGRARTFAQPLDFSPPR